jgi:hypothetical protein
LTPFLILAVLVLAAWAQQEISVSRQSPAIIEAGDYVSYEATVTNAGAPASEGALQVHFVSAGGKSDSRAEFTIPSLAPGQTKQLHLGPFKVVEAGEHFLYLGTENVEPADSFVAYGAGTGNAAVAGAAVAGAGGALVAWYLKKRT